MTDQSMAGAVVIVTGAGSGIGAATARLLATRGAGVAATDIDPDAAARTVADITATDGRAVAVAHDVSNRESWDAVVAEAAEALGAISGLVNNAGITRDRSLLKMSDDDWTAVIDVHLRGTWLGCQTVVPHLRENGGGAIVNLSSVARHGAFGQANYSAAKAGIVGLTRTVAFEGARHGIRVNAVAPGAIDTPMVAAVPAEIRDSWTSAIPLGRFGEPREVAAAIAFLLSDESSYITAHVLGVDGGADH